MMWCPHDKTTMYGSSEQCLECGARRHRNSQIWHQDSQGSGNQTNQDRQTVFVLNRYTGEVGRK